MKSTATAIDFTEVFRMILEIAIRRNQLIKHMPSQHAASRTHFTTHAFGYIIPNGIVLADLYGEHAIEIGVIPERLSQFESGLLTDARIIGNRKLIQGRHHLVPARKPSDSCEAFQDLIHAINDPAHTASYKERITLCCDFKTVGAKRVIPIGKHNAPACISR